MSTSQPLESVPPALSSGHASTSVAGQSVPAQHGPQTENSNALEAAQFILPANMTAAQSTHDPKFPSLPITNGESNIASAASPSIPMYTPAPPLASSRYNRQLLIPQISLQGQQRISSSKILIIGLGGLGSPASLYLAGAGVGKLGLMDDDKVEMSNLHRQIVHREDSVTLGMGKVQSAVRGCRELNSQVEVVGHEMSCDVSGVNGADGEKLFRIVDGYDVILDCTDNPATRYLISDICVLLGKVLVSGAAQRLEGQLCLLNYPITQHVNEHGTGVVVERGPCYRCVFPIPPSPEMVKGCGEIGILGPVVGTIGTLMANEALRYVVKGVEEGRKPSMLLHNAWSADPRGMFRSISLRGRRKDCVACGDDETLHEKGKSRITREVVMSGRLDYVRFCGVVEDVKVLKREERVTAVEFLKTSDTNTTLHEKYQSPTWASSVVVDVREPHEVELGAKIGGSVNIPLSQILRQDGKIAEMDNLLIEGDKNAVVFVCQLGNDSQIAAKKLMDFRGDKTDASKTDGSREMFIGDVVGGFAAIERELT